MATKKKNKGEKRTKERVKKKKAKKLKLELNKKQMRNKLLFYFTCLKVPLLLLMLWKKELQYFSLFALWLFSIAGCQEKCRKIVAN